MDNDYFREHFEMYTKIQDPLLYLGNHRNKALISVVLNAANTIQDNTKYYYREIMYFSSKLNMNTIKIRRDYNAYLSLENVKPIDNYIEYIVIQAKDLELLRLHLIPYLESIIQNYNEIYYVDSNDKLNITDKVAPYLIGIGDKEIKFEPGMCQQYNGDEYQPGVEMYLNSDINMVSLDFNQVYGLLYLIRTFDLYGYANTMLNFLQRPPVGTNRHIMTSSGISPEPQLIPYQEPIEKRVVQKKRQKSYFDKKNTESNNT